MKEFLFLNFEYPALYPENMDVLRFQLLDSDSLSDDILG